MAWRDNKALAGVLAVLGIAAIAYAVISFMPAKTPRDIMCEKCQAISNVQLPAGTAYPITCPKCSSVAAYQCSKATCPKCPKGKNQFTVIDKGTGELPKCPQCGSEM
jgi:Zn finger protein HypA/HybF involved in hydrogenase expression